MSKSIKWSKCKDKKNGCFEFFAYHNVDMTLKIKAGKD